VLDGALKATFFYLNLLLVGCVLGITFISQAMALGLCKFYISIILKFMPQDAKLLPLIFKNLESHSMKNLHANLLYRVTVCFLVFQATNFLALSNYSQQMTDVLFGGDINLMAVDKGSMPHIDEFKLERAM
jgi:uncharacterized membrane protein